ncbi:hypothetical protein [Subtercola boreus]|nr:hypothetical protein [Subtercola boreus]
MAAPLRHCRLELRSVSLCRLSIANDGEVSFVESDFIAGHEFTVLTAALDDDEITLRVTGDVELDGVRHGFGLLELIYDHDYVMAPPRDSLPSAELVTLLDKAAARHWAD